MCVCVFLSVFVVCRGGERQAGHCPAGEHRPEIRVGHGQTEIQEYRGGEQEAAPGLGQYRKWQRTYYKDVFPCVLGVLLCSKEH